MYPLKTTIETAQIGLTGNYEARARLYLDFAARRLVEMKALIAAGRYSDLARAVQEFEWDIRLALDAVEKLSKTDPARAAALNAEINAILIGYSNILGHILIGLPTEVQPIILNVIIIINVVIIDLDIDDDHGTGDDGKGTATPMSTISVTPVRTATIVPTSTPMPTVTHGVTKSAPIPGGSNDNVDDDDDDNDDDDDDDDD
jgi:hypothetical protein